MESRDPLLTSVMCSVKTLPTIRVCMTAQAALAVACAPAANAERTRIMLWCILSGCREKLGEVSIQSKPGNIEERRGKEWQGGGVYLLLRSEIVK